MATSGWSIRKKRLHAWTFIKIILCSLPLHRKEKTGKKVPHVDVEDSAKRTTDFGSSKMNEYLLGSRKLKIFPVAMSLVGR